MLLCAFSVAACHAARASAAPCVVPERLHLSALIFETKTQADAAGARLKSEAFTDVGKSMPDNYSTDVGWFTPQELAGSQYQTAATLAQGQTAPFAQDAVLPGFVHVDKRLPQSACNAAIAADPHDAWARVTRASAEAASAQYDRAVADYNVAYSFSSDARFKTQAAYGLASAYYSERRYRKALDFANDAVASNSGQSYVLRAYIYEALGDDDLATADAATALAQLHGNEQDESPAHLVRGIAYSDTGFFKAAADEFGLVLARHPNDSYALASRGFARFASGDTQAARKDLLASAVANPRNETPLLGLAILEYASGGNNALKYARRAYAVNHEPYAALWLRILGGSNSVKPHVDASLVGLNRKAANGDKLTQSNHVCEATYYTAVFAIQHHNTTEGRQLLEKATEICPYREYERAAAIEMLKR